LTGVLANPPFSLKGWGKDEAEGDSFGRFPYGTPPKDAGDLAFVQHMISSLNAEGMMGVVMPHGVLFRGSSEKEIRKGILEDDLLEAVVGLPSQLFYGTGIPASLLILNKKKPADRKGKVIFINGELEFQEAKNQNKLSDNKLRDLLSHFSQYRLRNADFDRPDLLGAAYEYVIKQFADSAGKKGGEFYTPSEVVKLLVALLKPHAGMKIYDPTAGSGGMLIQTRHYLTEHGENPRNLSLYGQEMNLGTWAICKMNMFLHGVMNADIRKGDTLREPQHIQDGLLMSFDRGLGQSALQPQGMG
jgi:type I restriction-modification system DNA methylase subunit